MTHSPALSIVAENRPRAASKYMEVLGADVAEIFGPDSPATESPVTPQTEAEPGEWQREGATGRSRPSGESTDDSAPGTPPEPDQSEFLDLMPLDAVWCDTPFPIDALPAWAADFVTAAAASAQVPPAMAGTAFLGALATCTRNNVIARFSDDYVEPTALWLVMVASSGERKSQNVSLLLGPAYHLEREMNDNLAPVIARDEAHQTSLDAEVTIAENALKRKNMTAEDRHAATADLISARERRARFDPTTAIQLIADDATPEAIVTRMLANNETLSVVSTEGNLFSIMTGRYNDKPFVESLLKAHNGDTIKVDRQGRPPQYLHYPRLSLTIATQPSVLAEIGKNETLRGNGFIARILPCFPRPAAGSRTFRSEPIPPAVKTRYLREMTSLGSDFTMLTSPHQLSLAPDAYDELQTLHDLVEPRLGPGGELAHMGAWTSKLNGAVLRIAALLHVAEHGKNGSTVISAATTANARRIGEFFLDHAKAAHALMSGQENSDDAIHALRWAQKREKTRFTYSDFKNSSARAWTPERAASALETLIRHGYARMLNPNEDAFGRPAGATLELRPGLEGEETT